MAHADSDSDSEVRPFVSDQQEPSQEAHQDLSDLTKVASTSLEGLVATDVIRTLSHGAYGSTEDTQEDEEEPQWDYLVPKRQFYLIVTGVLALAFLGALDATILSTLVSDIASELNAIPYLSWITTSYLLATSIVQPLGGLSDIFGRKPMLLGCIVIFTLGIVQCATSASTVPFVAGRFLSGFSGGLNTLGTIIMSDLVPLRRRGVFQGLANTFYALGSATGGTVGGWIAHRYGWRMAFWFQVPIGIGCFFLIAFNMNLPPRQNADAQKSLSEKFQMVDVAGISTLASMLTVFIILTSTPIDSKILLAVLTVAFLGLLVLFLIRELAAPYPIVPIRLLKDRSVLGSALASFFGTMYIFVMLYYWPIYLSTVCGLNSGEIGVRQVPMIVLGSLASVFSGYYMKVTGKYWWFTIITSIGGTLGLVLVLLRTFPFGLKVTPTVFEQYTLSIAPDIAYAAMLTVTLLALIAAVPPENQSAIISIQYSFRGTGSILGTAVGSQIFTAALFKSMGTKLWAAKPDDVSKDEFDTILSKVLHDASYIRTEAPKWGYKAMVESYGIGCWSSYVFSAAVSVLCLLAVAAIKEYKLFTTIARDK